MLKELGDEVRSRNAGRSLEWDTFTLWRRLWSLLRQILTEQESSHVRAQAPGNRFLVKQWLQLLPEWDQMDSGLLGDRLKGMKHWSGCP